MSLERLWLAAWLEGLHAKPAIRPQEPLVPPIRLDDTGRPPHVPLRPDGGPR